MASIINSVENEYEVVRSYRYVCFKKQWNPPEYFPEAYKQWANENPGKRESEWDTYCDLRDGYALGTNASIRENNNRRIERKLV